MNDFFKTYFSTNIQLFSKLFHFISEVSKYPWSFFMYIIYIIAHNVHFSNWISLHIKIFSSSFERCITHWFTIALLLLVVLSVVALLLVLELMSLLASLVFFTLIRLFLLASFEDVPKSDFLFLMLQDISIQKTKRYVKTGTKY